MYSITIYVFIKYYTTAVFTRGFYANDDNVDTRRTHYLQQYIVVSRCTRTFYT